MFTNNFYAMIANLCTLGLFPSGSGNDFNDLGNPLVNVLGEQSLNYRLFFRDQKYENEAYKDWPFQPAGGIGTRTGRPGIVIGSGARIPQVTDFCLENEIRSEFREPYPGAHSLYAEEATSVRSEKNNSLIYESVVTVENRGTETETIREIGYLAAHQTSTFCRSNLFLIDRTLLREPVVIQPGETKKILYVRKAEKPALGEKNGVKLVPFERGSEEEIAAMIDAAHAGIIDLQSDGKWQVGDRRKINLGAFTSYADGQYPEYEHWIMISNFGERYNNGAVLEFDFVTCPLCTRMHSNNFSKIGYKDTDIAKHELPAVASALPDWMRSRLVPFSILCQSHEEDSRETELVDGNLLALRSASELSFDIPNPCVFEGDTPAAFRYTGNINHFNVDYLGRINLVESWTRSFDNSASGRNVYYLLEPEYMGGFSIDFQASDKYNSIKKQWIAPFGCL